MLCAVETMITMAQQILLLFMFLILCMKETSALEAKVVLSGNRGKDSSYCGSIKFPCRTITFAIEKRLTHQRNIVLLLEPGSVYNTNRSIILSNVTQTITIQPTKESNHLSFKSTIRHDIEGMPLFIVSLHENEVNISVQSLAFESTSIVHCTQSTCHVNLDDVECTYMNYHVTKDIFIVSYFRDGSPRPLQISRLRISNSTFRLMNGSYAKNDEYDGSFHFFRIIFSIYGIYINQTEVDVFVKSAIYVGCEVHHQNDYFHAHNSTLHFENVHFMNHSRSAFRVDGILRETIIHKCSFVETRDESFLLRSAIYFNCHNCRTHSDVYLSVSHTSLKRSGYYNTRLIVVNMTTALFQNITVENGMENDRIRSVLDIEKSKVNIQNFYIKNVVGAAFFMEASDVIMCNVVLTNMLQEKRFERIIQDSLIKTVRSNVWISDINVMGSTFLRLVNSISGFIDIIRLRMRDCSSYESHSTRVTYAMIVSHADSFNLVDVQVEKSTLNTVFFTESNRFFAESNRFFVRNFTLRDNTIKNRVFCVRPISSVRASHVTVVNNTLFLFISSIGRGKKKFKGEDIVLYNNTITESVIDLGIETEMSIRGLSIQRNLISTSVAWLSNSKLSINLTVITQNTINNSMFRTTVSDLRVTNISISNNRVSYDVFTSIRSTVILDDHVIIENSIGSSIVEFNWCSMNATNGFIVRNEFWDVGISAYRFVDSDVSMQNVSIETDRYRGSGNYFSVETSSSTNTYSDRLVPKFHLVNIHLSSIDRNNVNTVISLRDIHPDLVDLKNVTIYLPNQHTSAIYFVFNYRLHFSKIELNFYCQNTSTPKTLVSLELPYYIYQVSCQMCPVGSFSSTGTSKQSVYDVISYQSNTRIQKSLALPKGCQQCPAGSRCYGGLARSRGNFFGYRKKETNMLEFLPCPSGYCCGGETRKCESIDTCALHRKGVLCGSCEVGFIEHFYTTQCIPSHICNKEQEFWMLYAVTAFLVVLLFTFLSDMKTTLKRLWAATKTKLLQIFKQKESDNQATGVVNRVKYCDNKMRKSETASRDSPVEYNSAETVVLANFNTADTVDTKLEDEETVIANRKHNKNLPTSSDDTNSVRSIASTDSETFGASKNNAEHSTMNASAVGEIRRETALSYTVSGILNGLIAFYQIKSLLTVELGKSSGGVSNISAALTTIFNFELVINFSKAYCPNKKLNTIEKYFYKYFLFTIMALLFTCVSMAIQCCLGKFMMRCRNICRVIRPRLGICYIRILLFGYKNMVVFTLTVLNCVEINGEYILFVNGDFKCYKQWQYAVIVFIVLWVLPFPFMLASSYKLYREKRISFNKMLIIVTCPPFYFIFWKRHPDGTVEHNLYQYRMISELYEEPYRLKENTENEYVFWENWRLIQRVILSALSIFSTNPLIRLCLMVPFILLFIVVYFKVLPFKKEMSTLHWLEISSMLSFCYLLVQNLFRAFLYTYSFPELHPLPVLMDFFNYGELIFSPLTVLFVILIFNLVVKKMIEKFTDQRKKEI